MNNSNILDEVFEKFVGNTQIFKDREVLRHDYLPDRLPHREEQIKCLGQTMAPFQIRFARNGEPFTGIGMNRPITLTDKMLVLADEKQILCIYPYRDLGYTKITRQTRNVLIVGYGAPRIIEQRLKKAVETKISYIKLVSDGETEMTRVFKNQ